MAKFKVDVRDAITKRVLQELGIPVSISGFTYLQHIIVRYDLNQRKQGFVKLLGLVGEAAFDEPATFSKVERCCRYAVSTVWKAGNWPLLKVIFGSSIKERVEKSGGFRLEEFVATMAMYLEPFWEEAELKQAEDNY